MDTANNLTDEQKHIVEHITNVMENIFIIKRELSLRAKVHDKSKLMSPEIEYLEQLPPKKDRPIFGTEEYDEVSEQLSPALKHHYKVNRHHPQYFENGINDMTIVDIIEMFCDWMASAEDHETNGNIYRSIKICSKKFGICEQLMLIFRNTAKTMHENESNDEVEQ
jgi:hypothetical protein